MTVKYLIIGAGAAGLQLAYFLEQSGDDYLVVEASAAAGTFWKRYPRSRRLISFNKVHSIYDDPELQMRYDWNSLLTNDYSQPFASYSKRLFPAAKEMVRYLGEFASRHELKIRFRSRVSSVRHLADGMFRVSLGDGTVISSQYVVLAAGVHRPYVPPIPGIELVEGYETASFEPESYRDQRVLVIGKGNSAFEVAHCALETAKLVHLASPSPARLAWKTKHSGDIRTQYAILIDSYQLKLLNGILDCHIDEIARDGRQYLVRVTYTHAEGEHDQIEYDRIVRCTGFSFDPEIFAPDSRPETTIDGRFPAMTSSWESVNVPGLYFAGTLMQAIDFRVSASAFVSGFRYNIRTLHKLLKEREGEGGPDAVAMPADPEAIAGRVLRRVSQASSLWSQFSFLCDAIMVDRDRGTATYTEDIPIALAADRCRERECWYTVNYEWGTRDVDPFNIPRHPRHERAADSQFLHPVVRQWSRSALVTEHHILEDLLGVYVQEVESSMIRSHSGRDIGQYHEDEHVGPMRRFFEGAGWLAAVPSGRT